MRNSEFNDLLCSFNPERTVPPEQIKKVWNSFFKVKNIKIAFLIHERVLDSSFACCICGAPSSDKNKLCDHLRE
jgi:hypothetical protein